jgi:hypothetical protein
MIEDVRPHLKPRGCLALEVVLGETTLENYMLDCGCSKRTAHRHFAAGIEELRKRIEAAQAKDD